MTGPSPELEARVLAEVRTGNARIAHDYDALHYEEAPEPLLDPKNVLNVGRTYGCHASAGDILDLGCGAGVQLSRAGREASGRLVGVDLGVENCRRAVERCREFGDRAQILNADLLDVKAEQLGTFDVIYAVGTVYVVPPEVRARVFEVIANCLRPGGVALISYYSGTLPAMRAYVHGLLRNGIAPTSNPLEAVARARQLLQTLAQGVDPRHPSLMLHGMQQTASLPDATFYHEVFNPFFTPLHTSELQRVLGASGIDFCVVSMDTRLGKSPRRTKGRWRPMRKNCRRAVTITMRSVARAVRADKRLPVNREPNQDIAWFFSDKARPAEMPWIILHRNMKRVSVTDGCSNNP